MQIKKPASVAKNLTMSQKWDEITDGRNFQTSDVPTIALLCQWYAIVEKCMDDLDYGGEIQVAYQNDMSDLKSMPQIATLKQASAEIRALNKQLGINDEATDKQEGKKETKLYVFQRNRQSKAANSGRTA